MGIMHKLMQRKDIEMNVTQRSGNAAEPLVVPAEKEFTAEHILQLCKFLAEKSKRNKTLHKQRRELKRQAAYQNNALQFEDINETPQMTEAEPLLQDAARLSGSHSPAVSPILMDKSPTATTNSENAINTPIAIATTTSSTVASASCALQYTQGKRDILLKIRNQIFERKRQRQVAQLLQQRCGVWRPW